MEKFNIDVNFPACKSIRELITEEVESVSGGDRCAEAEEGPAFPPCTLPTISATL
ncbi:hypothetical protein [uncultured Microbulbifer sp.]|uniref:hypothetical protein n=1 Tax=uncultured Microbulbifer sp. TaxID=348147 RepID=UPI002638863C|nr:hypothetical protein [uncultured Microbulbifer sp.]